MIEPQIFHYVQYVWGGAFGVRDPVSKSKRKCINELFYKQFTQKSICSICACIKRMV